MSLYAIRFKRDSLVRYAIETRGNPEYSGVDSGTLQSAKTWKTKNGARKYLETHVLVGRQGERLQARWTDIAVVEITPQQQYSINNPEVIRESKTKYDSKRPVLSFRPKPEILEWLEEERSPSETDAQLLNRKLGKLMELEKQKVSNMNFENIQATLLSEINDLEESLQIIKCRVKEGIPVGSHANVTANKINNLIGKYQLLLDDAVVPSPKESDLKANKI